METFFRGSVFWKRNLIRKLFKVAQTNLDRRTYVMGYSRFMQDWTGFAFDDIEQGLSGTNFVRDCHKTSVRRAQAHRGYAKDVYLRARIGLPSVHS